MTANACAWLLGLLPLASLSAEEPPPRAKNDRAAVPKPGIALSFDQILQRLWDKDQAVREAAIQELADFQQRAQDPGTQAGLKAIRAAVSPYPFKNPERDAVSAGLVAVASASPHAEYVPVVLEVFTRLSDGAKLEAQLIVTKLQSREAAEAFMALVKTHAPADMLPGLATWPLEKDPRHADVLFPEILKYAANPAVRSEIFRLCLAYCEAGGLPAELRSRCTEPLVTSYEALAKELRPLQKDQGIAWMWDGRYQEARGDAGILLDVFGFLPDMRVEKALRDALAFKDPRLKHFAVVSLIRLGKPVEKTHLEDVARHAEMRNWLYSALRELGKDSLFPEKYRTQKALAEADMVNWLVYPTELARVPDEIELMKVVPVDTGLAGGIYDYYLFRFRTHEPHWAAKQGWLAGVSGPFLRKDQPTVDALGDTFSRFEKWDSKPPDAHLGDTRELMRKWREYHAANKR